MLQYLIIQLDDVSTSYCHYDNNNCVPHLISTHYLKEGIRFAMKENLMIHFVYPNYELPKEYKDIINTIDHKVIVSSLCEDTNLRDNADIIVFKNWTGIETSDFKENVACILRTSKDELFDKYLSLNSVITKVSHLNIVITDIENFTDNDFNKYKSVLQSLSNILEKQYIKGRTPQLNLLTDRILLDKMNNCNAGYENITLAPDGNFYVCPAFYLAAEEDEYGLGKSKFSIGNLETGLNIKNPQLYKINYAPLCRTCDAYQCKRCVWLNRKMTYEINTPSHEQCVISHIERNTSRQLRISLETAGVFLIGNDIPQIDYLDPFEKILK